MMATNGLSETDPNIARKIAEKEFHDRRELDRQSLSEAKYLKKYSNKKWYVISKNRIDYIDAWIAQNVPGKKILDFGCGLGEMSLKLASAGGVVNGIDISPESVASSRALLKKNGYDKTSHFEVMDGEKMGFEDDTFDAIICSGVLHHVDVTIAFPELARVLKPTGKLLASEALGYNPIINLYRRLTPSLRTEWETDHIITGKQLRLARSYFSKINCKYFHLFAILAVPFRRMPFFGPMLKFLSKMDDLILKIPLLRLMAWQILFELSSPKKTG